MPRHAAVLFFAVQETLRPRLRAERSRRPAEAELLEALLAWTLRDPRANPPDPVVERDGCRGAVPGCTGRRKLHDHHVCFRAVAPRRADPE